MAPADRARILTINAGSPTLKAALYDMDRVERLMLAVQVERISQSGSQTRIVGGDGVTLLDRTTDLDDHQTAVRAFLEWLRTTGLRSPRTPSAIASCTVDARIARRTS